MDDWLVAMRGSHLKLVSINHSGLSYCPKVPCSSARRKPLTGDGQPPTRTQTPTLQAAPSPEDVSHGRRGLVPSGLV